MATADEFALEWLSSRVGLGIRPGLQRIQSVLAALSHPERGLRFVHVAGTNGKGSVSSILATLLSQDMRVGLFTSPGKNGRTAHFEVVGENPSPSDLNFTGAKIREAEALATSADLLTEFEVLTAMAFLYFNQRNVDMVVLEAGMGGRLDATNVVVPEVSVITNVSFDHEAVLGSTLTRIAYEKAGIIKQGVPVITGAHDEALSVIRLAAEQQGADLKILSVDFGATCDSYTYSGQLATYRGLSHDFHRLAVPLYGTYQVDNLSVALAAYESLVMNNRIPRMSDKRVRDALTAVQWPGRWEVRWHEGRVFVLDGSHNPAAARALFKSLKEFSRLWRIKLEDWLFIVGMLGDKDVDTMLEVMSPLMSNAIVCEPNHFRALAGRELEEELRELNVSRRVQRVDTVADAVTEALRSKRPVCCWGSLYTVEEARKAMRTILGDS